MPQLSIVVPTFNEAGNVAELRNRVAAALPAVDWEMIYVDDDSPDGTAATVRELAQRDSQPKKVNPFRRIHTYCRCIFYRHLNELQPLGKTQYQHPYLRYKHNL